MYKTFTTSNYNTYYFIAKHYDELKREERNNIEKVYQNKYFLMTLYQCYEKPSNHKRNAYDCCVADLRDIIKTMCNWYGGSESDYNICYEGIITYNTCVFTYGACIYSKIEDCKYYIYCAPSKYWCIKLLV